MKARRASLTPKERREMIARQGYACFIFGCTEKPEVAEHWTCVAIGNDQKPDCMLCKWHAKEKTRLDMGRIAKVKRLRNGKTQYDKRKARGSKMKSRGFDRTKTKRMDGTVTPRSTRS